ncbi:MAG TPA: hypothetical protein DIW47_06295 [Bacteroidetes bacterium]|nr:hypothetical protein [Bacteroidota bacterium]
MTESLTNYYQNHCNYRLFGLVIFLLIFTQGYTQSEITEQNDSTEVTDTTHYVKNKFESFIPQDSGLYNLRIDTPQLVTFQKPSRPSLSLPGVKPLLRSNGQVTLDNHYATLQNPYMRSSQVYSRLNYTGNVFIAGLPFKTTAFLTTENNSVYQSNYINIRFDAVAYKKQLRDQAEKEAKGLGKSVSFNRIVLDQLGAYLENLDKQISGNSLLVNGYIEAKDSLLSPPSFANPLDTLNTDYRNHLPEDTLSEKITQKPSEWRQNAGHRQDSLMQIRDSVMMRFVTIYNKFQEDSAKLAEYKTLIEAGPEAILKDSLSSRGSKQLAWISRVKNFQIGQAIVNYSELSLWGLSVKGMDVSAEINGWYTGATIGRAFNNEGMFDPISKPEFNKNIAGVQFGRVDKAGNKIIASYFYAKDLKEVQKRTQNQVLSIDVQKTYKKLSLFLSGASSEYQVFDSRVIGEAKAVPTSGKENKAWLSKFIYDIGYGAKVSAKWNYIGAMYTTVGNPFLRKNYLEKEFNWEQKWIKGKITSKVFYKKLTTLESELTPETNTTKGAGVQLQSSFSKGVNFFALYSPYELGNNHPDTVFRTFNRTSLLSAGVSYSKMWKRALWFSQFILSESSISGENLPLTQSTQYSFENSLSIDGLHDMRIDASINRSRPNLDSMNFSSLNGQYLRTIKQNLALGGGFKMISFSKESSLMGMGINVRWVLLKKIQVNSSFDLDHVKNWWGVEGTKLVSTMNLKVGYSW